MEVHIKTAAFSCDWKTVPLTERVAQQLPYLRTGGEKKQYTLMANFVMKGTRWVLIHSPFDGPSKWERSNYVNSGSMLGNVESVPHVILL